MNLRNLILISLFFTTLSVSTEIIAVGVQWESSVEKAFARAKREGKPIFIDVYADWCGYCKTLKKEIYPKKEVQAELSRFVLLSLDGDRFPNLKKIPGLRIPHPPIPGSKREYNRKNYRHAGCKNGSKDA